MGTIMKKPSINGFIDDSLAKIALLFDQLKNRIITLKLATQSSKRSIIGKNTMNFVLTEDGRTIVAQIQQVMQKIRDNYKSVISIDSVNLQNAQPPEQVQASFEDAIKAREELKPINNGLWPLLQVIQPV
jgi:regulator of protease activity HflC (stomatin/prohibitin superfamily)